MNTKTPILDRTDADGNITGRGMLTLWERAMRSKPKSTTDTYRAGILRFVAYLNQQGREANVETITRNDVIDFIDALTAEGRAAATVQIYVRGLRSLIREAVERGFIDTDPLDKIGRRLPKVDDEVPLRILSDEQVTALRRACAGLDFFSVRNRAIIEVLLSTGVRRSELTNLKVGDVFLAPGGGMIRVTVSKTFGRDILLSPRAADALDDYLIERRNRSASTDYLFIGPQGKALRGEGLWDVIHRLGDKAGISDPTLHPHDFRHYAVATDKRDGRLTETQMLYKYGWHNAKMLHRYAFAVNKEVSVAAQARALYGDKAAAMLSLLQAQPAAA